MRITMPSPRFLAVAFLLVACAPKGPTADESIAAANALDQEFLDTFNRGDLNAIMATYWNNPDLVSIGLDGMGGTGWEGPKSGWEAAFAAMPGAQMTFPEMHNIPAGEVVLGWGTWAMTIPNGDGTSTVLQGRYSDVKAPRDGKWVYLMDHASVPMPPAPAVPTAN